MEIEVCVEDVLPSYHQLDNSAGFHVKQCPGSSLASNATEAGFGPLARDTSTAALVILIRPHC